MHKKITPIILAGGSGTRLWPLSTTEKPKQFSKFSDGNLTLFQKTLQRFKPKKTNNFCKPVIVSNTNFYYQVLNQITEIDYNYEAIIFEPEPRNTAASIAVALQYLLETDQNKNVLISPCDHFFEDEAYFENKLTANKYKNIQNKIILFGAVPDRGETSYGYIKINKNKQQDIHSVESFIEKPDQDVANKFYKSGEYMWNCGIFLSDIMCLKNAFEKFSNKLFIDAKEALSLAHKRENIYQLNKNEWKKLKSNSIDYEIIEKYSDLCMIPIECGWSDLGTWQSVWSSLLIQKISQTKCKEIHCSNNVMINDSNKPLVTIGLNNTLVIQTKEITLVVNKDYLDRIPELKNYQDIEKYSEFERRPWGSFNTIRKGEGFKVKILNINPKNRISLQYHKKRTEHWTILKGAAHVTLNGKSFKLVAGESIDIPLNAVHRLENKDTDALQIIEIQKGAYLEEDDIIRIDDDYSRK